MLSSRALSLGLAVAICVGGLAVAGPAKADWGHHGWDHGWHHGWHRDWHHGWGPPAVVVVPRTYYAAPRAYYYAPPPVYYAPPPYYAAPGVSFGFSIR